jgi:hypothetical protein
VTREILFILIGQITVWTLAIWAFLKLLGWALLRILEACDRWGFFITAIRREGARRYNERHARNAAREFE